MKSSKFIISKGLLLFLSVLCVTIKLSAQTTVSVTDFGVKPNSFSNAGPAIRR